MKQRYLKWVLLPLLPLFTLSSQTIEKYYIDMPAFVNPILSSKQRMEMIEYAKVGQIDSIANQFGRNSQLQQLDLKHNYICVAHTEASLFEMRLYFDLERADSLRFLTIVETVCAPICASTITRYSANWEKMETVRSSFATTDFLDVSALQDANLLEEAVAKLPAIFVQATIDRESGDLLYSNNTILQLSPEEQERFTPYMRSVRKKNDRAE